jgi:transcriptional regulator with XRE-family HTH domain
MDFAARLTMTRRARGIRQYALAKYIGISTKHLCSLETGKTDYRQLRVGILLDLAQALEVSTDYLLGGATSDAAEDTHHAA